MALCACGCGGTANPGKVFLQGHNTRQAFSKAAGLDKNTRYEELGATGLKRYAGVVEDDFIGELERHSDRVKVYDEMRLNDPVLNSILFIVEQALRRVEWLVEPAIKEENEDAKAADIKKASEYAKFVTECMNDMSHTWDDFISECLTFLVQGWAFFEVVYKQRKGDKPGSYTDDPAISKYDDGKVGWRKFAVRSQSSLARWEFDEHGGIQGFYQRPPPTYELFFIPIEKGLLFRTRVEKNNPEGRSVLRAAYKPNYFRKNLEIVMAIGVERDIAGMPVIYLPPNASETDKTDARNLAERVRRDEYFGVTIPGPKATSYETWEAGGWLLEMMGGAGEHSIPIVELLEYYDRREAMVVLAQFLLLGSGTTGSWALSKDQSDLFLMALQGWANAMADTLNRHATPKLVVLNGWDKSLSPTIVPSSLARADLAELGKWLEVMIGAGFRMDDLENHLRTMADLPPKAEELIEQERKEKEEMRQQMMQNPPEEEEEEVEKSWTLKGHIPTEQEVEDDWEIDPETIAVMAKKLEKILG